MNWKIIEISCNCELESFLTWKDAIRYFKEKKLNENVFTIVSNETYLKNQREKDRKKYLIDYLHFNSRKHNILVLKDLGKEEPYKDVLTVGEAAKKFKKIIFKVRFLEIKVKVDFKKEVIIKKPNGSDKHKTNLKDLTNNFYHLRKPLNNDSLYNFYSK